MKQTRIPRRRPRRATRWPDPLPLDPRDRDVVHAKRATGSRRRAR